MSKKVKLASQKRRVKSIASRLGSKPRDATKSQSCSIPTVSGKVVHYWYWHDEREKRWFDHEGIAQDNGKNKPRVHDVTHYRGGRRHRRLPKVDSQRLKDMEHLMWEDVMANEIAKRAGALPPVQWKPGGDMVWTAQLDTALLEHLANGGTFTSFANRVKCSRSAVVARAEQEDIAPLIEQAKAQGIDAMAEKALEVACTPMITERVIEVLDQAGNTRERHVNTQDSVDARKLVFQSHMQMLSKLAPNKYGEKPEVKQTDTMAQQILKARARLRSD